MTDTHIPKIYDAYRHYKGGCYIVLSVSMHSETKEVLVTYMDLSKRLVWTRPLSMWNEVVDDKGTRRFTLTGLAESVYKISTSGD